jgi:hypothetical protein
MQVALFQVRKTLAQTSWSATSDRAFVSERREWIGIVENLEEGTKTKALRELLINDIHENIKLLSNLLGVFLTQCLSHVCDAPPHSFTQQVSDKANALMRKMLCIIEVSVQRSTGCERNYVQTDRCQVGMGKCPARREWQPQMVKCWRQLLGEALAASLAEVTVEHDLSWELSIAVVIFFIVSFLALSDVLRKQLTRVGKLRLVCDFVHQGSEEVSETPLANRAKTDYSIERSGPCGLVSIDNPTTKSQ